MNQAQKRAVLQRWHDRIVESDELIEPVIDALQLSPESPVCAAVWSLQGALTESVQSQMDWADWLSWYAYINGMGSKGLEAGPNGATRPIRTLDDLLWLVELE